MGKENIELKFKTLICSFLNRPSSGIARLQLNDMTLIDSITGSSLYPTLIKGKGADASRSLESVSEAVLKDPLLKLTYEFNPLDGKSDRALEVQMKPLEIVYVKASIDALISFFEQPVSENTFNTLKIATEGLQAGLKGISRFLIYYCHFNIDQ